MAYLILSFFPIAVLIYNIYAMIFHVSPFKVAQIIAKKENAHKLTDEKPPLTVVIAKPFAKYIPISLAKNIRLSTLLQSARVDSTPKEFVAQQLVVFAINSIFSIPFFIVPLNGRMGIMAKVFGFCIVLLGGWLAYSRGNELKKMADRNRSSIEGDLPQFIETFIQTSKINRNIETILDNYIRNYNNALSRELKMTVADMRTGGQEKALLRLDARINIPLFSQFMRGVRASLNGDDMTLYFQEITYKVETFRKQRMIAVAQAVKPKIAKMSTIRTFWCVFTLIFISLITVASNIAI